MAQSTIGIALLFVLVLQALMFMASTAMAELNPGSEFYHLDGTIASGFNIGNTTSPMLNTDGITESLPSSEGSISPTTGNFFTDSFGSIKRWFVDLPGINYVYGIVMAPYNIVKMMGLPGEASFAIGSIWYGISIFLIVAFFWGKE